MKVFEYDSQDNQAYIYAPDDIADACSPDLPRSLAAGWSRPTFELVRDDEYRTNMPKADFLTLTIATVVLSDRAVDQLYPILKDCGEILPITLSNDHDQYYLFNVTRVIDAIDMNCSKFMRFSDGRIMKVERLEFNPAKIPNEPAFFKSSQLGVSTEIYANEAAVNALREADLTGHDFRLIWSNE